MKKTFLVLIICAALIAQVVVYSLAFAQEDSKQSKTDNRQDSSPAAQEQSTDQKNESLMDNGEVDPDHGDDTPVLSHEEALAEDAKQIAKEEGISLSIVNKRVKFQNQIINFLEGLDQTQLESTFAGMEIKWNTSPSATMYFKGTPPVWVKDAVAKQGLDSIQQKGGQRHNLQELIMLQDAIHFAVVKQGYKDVVSSFDLATQKINIDIAGYDGTQLRGKELATAIIETVRRESATRNGMGSDVTKKDFAIYDRGKGPLTIPEHSYGGAKLLDDGTFECTSGFTVRRTSDGKEGTLTAGHCEGINQMNEHTTSGSVSDTFSAPWAAEHIGYWGDVEWHTTTHDDFPEFWSSTGTRRAVAGTRGTPVVGELVCRYGRKTGSDCGEVSAVNTTATFEWEGCGGCTVTAKHLVDAKNVTSAGGDSGGPWYYGGIAYGIHHGSRDNGNRIFSKIRNAESAFGVAVEIK